MNYNDLKILIESRKTTIKEIAERLEMTSTGFKRSIETEALGFGKVKELCLILGISVSEFFGEEKSKTFNMSGNTVAGEHAYYYGGSPIRLLELQLKEKDNQIKELLQIIKSNK